jgi:phosphatidylglycerophosphate synthase
MISTALVLLPPRPGSLVHSTRMDPLTHVGGITLLQRALCSLQRAGLQEGLVLSQVDWPDVARVLGEDPRCRSFTFVSLAETRSPGSREGSSLDKVLAGAYVLQNPFWIVERQALSDFLHIPDTRDPDIKEPIVLEPNPAQGTPAEGLPPLTLVPAGGLTGIAEAIAQGKSPDEIGAQVRAWPQKEVRTLPEPLLIRAERREDRSRAERLLFQGLIKPTESLMSRMVERKVSLAITRRLLYSEITPNQISVVSICLGVVSSLFFLAEARLLHVVGALLLLLSSIIDGCDGELARLRFQESRRGSWLDFLGDNLVHMVVFFCIGLGLFLRGCGTVYLVLGALGALFTLGSASAVFLRVFRKSGSAVISFATPVRVEEMKRAEGRLRRQIDFADKISNRDFIYLLLILAAVGQLWLWPWLSGLGTTFYFLYLMYLYRRMRTLARPTAT